MVERAAGGAPAPAFSPRPRAANFRPLRPGSPAGVRSSCESPAPPQPPWIRAHTPDHRTGLRRRPIPPESTVSHSGARRSPRYSTDAPRRTSEAPACDKSRPRSGGALRTLGMADRSDDFCPRPCGPVWAASTVRIVQHTEQGRLRIHCKYPGLRTSFILSSSATCAVRSPGWPRGRPHHHRLPP